MLLSIVCRLTSAYPALTGLHYDSQSQSETILTEAFRHQTQSSLRLPSPPDNIVLDPLECEGRWHGIN